MQDSPTPLTITSFADPQTGETHGGAMLYRRIAEHAERTPDRTALVHAGTRMRYAELPGRIRGAAAVLASRGVGAGTRVGIVLPNGPAWVTTFLAAAGLHALTVPVSPALRPEELRALLVVDNEVRLVVTDAPREATCRAALGDAVTILIADGEGFGIGDHETPDALALHERLAADDDSPVLVQYSTGSTGRAKKVLKSQRYIADSVWLYAAAIDMTASDTVISALPLFHEFGFVAAMCASFVCGGTLALLEPHLRDGLPVDVPFVMRVPRLLQLIAQERGTIVPAPPFLFGAMAETPPDITADLSSVRLWISAGNALPAETFDRFKARFGAPIRSLYGTTETGCVAINLDPADDVRPDVVGRPIPGVDVRVLPADPADQVNGEGPAVGELAVRSASVIDGYANQAQLKVNPFRDGWFLTGDLGRFDESGRLVITGRARIFIDSGGEKVDPGEVEQVARTHPLVGDIAVVGVPAAYGGEAIKAVIVPAGDLTEWDLLLYLRERLAEYKIPRFVEFRETLPRSPLGKLLRSALIGTGATAAGVDAGALRRRLLSGPFAASERLAQHELELAMCAHVAAQLQRPEADVDPLRPMAELGLSSLMILELRGWLESNLELTLPITIFWDYATPRDLAGELVHRLRAGRTVTVPAAAAARSRDAAPDAAEDHVRDLSDDEVARRLDELTGGAG